MLAQKHKNFRVLRVRAAIFCSSEVNTMGGFHIMGSSRWKGRGFFTYQTTDMPLLSTLYEPLSKQLISVLGGLAQRGAGGAVPAYRGVWAVA